MGATDLSKLDDLHEFIARRFQAEIQGLVGVEHCYYTNTETTDYVLTIIPTIRVR